MRPPRRKAQTAQLSACAWARRALPARQDSAAAALTDQLQASAAKGLALFAGADGGAGGYVAVSRFLEKLPAAEQENAANIFMKILNGSLWELWQGAREQAGLAPVETVDANGRFLQLATNALSDSFFYGAPVYLQLDEFVEIKASVFQVTRSPGKPVVYLGCVFLILGIFAMFYIRERRLWVWVRSDGAGGAHALMAMSTQRRTLDFEHEFNDMKARLPQPA